MVRYRCRLDLRDLRADECHPHRRSSARQDPRIRPGCGCHIALRLDMCSRTGWLLRGRLPARVVVNTLHTYATTSPVCNPPSAVEGRTFAASGSALFNCDRMVHDCQPCVAARGDSAELVIAMAIVPRGTKALEKRNRVPTPLSRGAAYTHTHRKDVVQTLQQLSIAVLIYMVRRQRWS